MNLKMSTINQTLPTTQVILTGYFIICLIVIIKIEDDPIYHVLEQPSVICQSCLCAQGNCHTIVSIIKYIVQCIIIETDPIYHEVGGNTAGMIIPLY